MQTETTNANLVGDILNRLARRKLLIMAVLFVVVSTGMAATFLITPKYEATMSLLVSRGRIDPQITSSDKSVDITSTAISDEEFNSELELLKSLEVIKGVVAELDLVNDQKPIQDSWMSRKRAEIKHAVSRLIGREKTEVDRSPAADSEIDIALEQAANRVESNLDVVPIKKSRVIKVTYTDTDPIRAKETLEAIYKRFVELHVQINERPEAMQVFNEQSEKFNEKLDASTRSLKNFDLQNGISGADIDTQQSLLQKQLSDAQTELNSTRTEIGETDKKIASLQEKIDAEPREIQTGYVSKYVQALDKMKEELTQLEKERTQLLQKYQPNSRFVRENQQQIDRIKKTIAEETANPPQERSYALNELRRRLEGELHDAETKAAALKDRERSLAGQIARLTTDVAALNSRSIERTELERQRSINEEAFLLYEKKARENEIGQVLNKQRIMNFAIVDAPRTDGQQKNPKPAMNLLVLLLIGTLTGMAAALILEKGQPVMAGSIRGIGGRYDLPVLVTIPYMELSQMSGSERKPRRRLLPAATDTVTRQV